MISNEKLNRKYFKMNQISNFYKWQNYNGVSENYSNDIQYRFAITDCFGWKAFYFVFFFFCSRL